VRSRRAGHVLAVALLCALFTSNARGQDAPVERESKAPTDAAISDAVARVKSDPALGRTRTIRTLGWRNSAPSPPSTTPAWLRWLVDLFRYVGQSTRVLVWVIVALSAVLLLFYLVRVLPMHRGRERDGELAAPTHVRDLDIRPESLPADIGLAARTLWDLGERRGALSLLYRGLLSRLAHVHRVPIRDSSTEGDCLDLARRHLAEEKHTYSSRLIRVWQRVVYGGADADADVVYALCDGFAAALDRGTAGAAAPRPAEGA